MASTLFLILALATSAAAFPLGRALSIGDYCNKVYGHANASLIAELDRQYESTHSRGSTPYELAGRPVCTPGCSIAATTIRDGAGWSGKCWGVVEGNAASQVNCLFDPLCTVKRATMLGPDLGFAGTVARGRAAVSGHEAFVFEYPPGSGGATVYEAFERSPMSDFTVDVYYESTGARSYKDFRECVHAAGASPAGDRSARTDGIDHPSIDVCHLTRLTLPRSEMKQVGHGMWQGRVYVRQRDGSEKLARRFVMFME